MSPRAAAAGAGRAAAAARGGGRAASAGALLFGPALPRPRRRGRASPLESAGRRRRSCKKRGERSRSAPGRGGERGGEAGPRVASRRVAARRALGSSAARAPLPARPSPPGEPSGRRAAYRHGRTSPCAEGASSPRRALSALLRRLPGTPKAERSSAPRRLSPRRRRPPVCVPRPSAKGEAAPEASDGPSASRAGGVRAADGSFAGPRLRVCRRRAGMVRSGRVASCRLPAAPDWLRVPTAPAARSATAAQPHAPTAAPRCRSSRSVGRRSQPRGCGARWCRVEPGVASGTDGASGGGHPVVLRFVLTILKGFSLQGMPVSVSWDLYTLKNVITSSD